MTVASAVTLPSILGSPEDLTPEVLNLVLQRRYPGVQVTAVRIRRTWQGTTTHLHIDVDYSENVAGLPTRLFVKTQLSSVHELSELVEQSLTEGGGSAILLRDETLFYRDLRADLEIETMVVYAAELLTGPNQFIIVAEDIAARDIVIPDIAAGLTAEQTDELLRTLAGVHASFWGNPRLSDDGDLNWLQHPAQGSFAEFFRTTGFTMVRNEAELPYKKELLARAGTDVDSLATAFDELLRRISSEPRTLVHGDPHVGNTYLLPDGRVGLLDWQLIRRGSWLHDINYALIGALEPDDRRAHQRELLDRYRARLVDAGVPAVPDRDEMWNAYRSGAAWGLALWLVTPDQMYSVDIVTAGVRRFAEAYAELGTGALLV